MEQQPYEEGSILENTPKHGSMAELIELSLAEDREKWRLEVNSLKLGSIANPETVDNMYCTRTTRYLYRYNVMTSRCTYNYKLTMSWHCAAYRCDHISLLRTLSEKPELWGMVMCMGAMGSLL